MSSERQRIADRDAAAIHRRRVRTGESMRQVLDDVPESAASRNRFAPPYQPCPHTRSNPE